MGFWSRIKNAIKKVVRVVKAVVRLVVRIVVTVVGYVIAAITILFPKKVRLQIFILSYDGVNGIINKEALIPSINYARRVMKDRFQATLRPYSKEWVQVITEKAPNQVLNVHCGLTGYGEEYGVAGDFFAKHLAGWNAIPISLTFPITVFIVDNIAVKNGCSFGPLTDYVTVDLDGVAETSTMMHEIGHACNLWHSNVKSNLMWPNNNRGDAVTLTQKITVRSSRHLTPW